MITSCQCIFKVAIEDVANLENQVSNAFAILVPGSTMNTLLTWKSKLATPSQFSSLEHNEHVANLEIQVSNAFEKV